MIKNTLFTFLVKAAIAVLTFFTAILTARYVGAGGRGVISLFVLNMSIVYMISNFIGGPGLVYLFTRHDSGKLFTASYLWAIVACLVIPVLLWLFDLTSLHLLFHLMMLSFLQSALRIQQNWLLANEKIKLYNATSAVFPAMHAIVLFIIFFIIRWHEVDGFIVSFYISIVSNLAVCSWFLYKNNAWVFSWDIKDVFKSSFKMGYVVQSANILQLLNYRFSFFLLQKYFGKFEVGLFSMATSFAEAAWIIANSFATIQYPRISNSKDDVSNRRLTVLFLRSVILLTCIPVIVLLLLPSEFFRVLLSKDFIGLPEIFPSLAPGIFFLAASIILSHYFSGCGNPRIGLYASAAGFLSTIICGFAFVPVMGVKGAAIAASISYGVTALTVLYFFARNSNLRLVDFIPSKNDLKELQAISGLKRK